MDDRERAQVLELYEEGELTKRAARELLGNEAFEEACEKARGVEKVLDGDTGRFLKEDE